MAPLEQAPQLRPPLVRAPEEYQFVAVSRRRAAIAHRLLRLRP